MTHTTLLLGKNGQLGWEAHRCLLGMGEVHAYDYPDIDFSRPEELRDLVLSIKPRIIFNAAAYTAVDNAETDKHLACAINTRTPEILAQTAKSIGAVMVHYSTDYVYDGKKGMEYVETDAGNPLNYYGQTKLDGDQAIQSAGGAHLIIRTSMVYTTRRASFVTKVLEWSRKQPELRIVSDQTGSPTWARLLAQLSVMALTKGGEALYEWIMDRSGVYHLAGNGSASRLEWAKAILENDPHADEQVAERIIPAKSSEFPTPAQRPEYSALNCTKFENTFGLSIPDWRLSLRLAMEQAS